MTENTNESVECIRKKYQPIYAEEIKESLYKGFHLRCLRCDAVYYHTSFAMSEMSYRMYSYCPNCIDEAIKVLKEQDQKKSNVDNKEAGE